MIICKSEDSIKSRLDRDDVAAFDALLADHPFGDNTYITQQLHICFERRLGKIASDVSAAKHLLQVLSRADAPTRHRVFGDTVLRCAIQQCLRRLELDTPYGLPLAQCSDVFATAAHQIEAGQTGLLAGLSPERIGPHGESGWIWHEDQQNSIFARVFQDVVKENYGEAMVSPTAAEIEILHEATRLLGSLLPRVSRSVLSHVHCLALFPAHGTWSRRASSSEFRLVGTVFLNREVLTDAWRVADHLFHEALHQQMYDFRHGHSLLEESFAQDDAPRICSLWNIPDTGRNQYWDAHRALAAFHVYVHLALLSLAADAQAGKVDGQLGSTEHNVSLTGSRTALDRAQYLGNQLRIRCWNELGPAGKKFLDWFDMVRSMLDTAPRQSGSVLHLLLDRYNREAREVYIRLTDNVERERLAAPLATLINREIDITRDILGTVGAASQLTVSLAEFEVGSRGPKFPVIRGMIAASIDSVNKDHLKHGARQACDDRMQCLIESSSEDLRVLLGR